MGSLIIGYAYNHGLCYVEVTADKDHFRLRNVSTGATRFTHRSQIDWRK